MPWPALLCFAGWLAYGYFQWRHSGRLRARVARTGVRMRTVGSAGLLILGAALLLAGLAVLEPLGLAVAGQIQPAGWLVVGIAGLGFVHAQVVAAALMVAHLRGFAEPDRNRDASKSSPGDSP